MYEQLEKQIIDRTREEFKDFPYFLNGHIFIKYDNGFITSDNSEPTIDIPTSITPLQAKLHLFEIDLLVEVEAMVKQDRKVEIYWTNAQNFYRTDEILLAMATALGLSDAQLDDLFLQASKL